MYMMSQEYQIQWTYQLVSPLILKVVSGSKCFKSDELRGCSLHVKSNPWSVIPYFHEISSFYCRSYICPEKSGPGKLWCCIKNSLNKISLFISMTLCWFCRYDFSDMHMQSHFCNLSVQWLTDRKQSNTKSWSLVEVYTWIYYVRIGITDHYTHATGVIA